MPYFAPHQCFLSMGRGAACATLTVPAPGLAAAIRRLHQVGAAVNGRGEFA